MQKKHPYSNINSDAPSTYALLDSGGQKKLEQFGPYRLVRPASQAIWQPRLGKEEWECADAIFTRKGRYQWVKKVPEWTITLAGVTFKLSPTPFGHVGIFPEQKKLWLWIAKMVEKGLVQRDRISILNLFAYSGGATLAAAKAGAEVCHVDASKGMVSWARENATLNHLDGIRWIVDDVRKFLDRELRRGKNRYDGIILDPPTHGRGCQGEVFTLENDLLQVVKACHQLLSPSPLFFLLTSHTPHVTSLGLHHLLTQIFGMGEGSIDHGEMLLEGGAGVYPLSSGVFARWRSRADTILE